MPAHPSYFLLENECTLLPRGLQRTFMVSKCYYFVTGLLVGERQIPLGLILCLSNIFHVQVCGTHVHRCVCTVRGTCDCVYICLWGPEVGIIGFFGCSLPYSLRQSPSIEARAHWYCLVSPTSLLQGLSVSASQVLGLSAGHHAYVAPPWVLEICSPVLQLAQQVLYLLSHLPNLILFSLADIFFSEVFIVFAKIGGEDLKTCSIQIIS